ncbi:citrate/2-methylcitrate synthase, partial [Rhodococcus fascians]
RYSEAVTSASVKAIGQPEIEITKIEDGELLYRGRRARDLIDRPFAEVVAWLWDAERVDAPDTAIGSARAMVQA